MRLIALVALVSACVGDEVVFPICFSGEIGATGVIGATRHVIKTTWKTYGFVNAFGGNGSFDAELTLMNGEGKLHLEWPELVSNGSEVEARGTLETGGLEVGNCLTDPGFPGTMIVDSDGKGGRFTLTELRNPPYCGGSPVSGRLAGCFRNR